MPRGQQHINRHPNFQNESANSMKIYLFFILSKKKNIYTDGRFSEQSSLIWLRSLFFFDLAYIWLYNYALIIKLFIFSSSPFSFRGCSLNVSNKCQCSQIGQFPLQPIIGTLTLAIFGHPFLSRRFLVANGSTYMTLKLNAVIVELGKIHKYIYIYIIKAYHHQHVTYILKMKKHRCVQFI